MKRIIVIDDCDLSIEEIKRRVKGEPEMILCGCGLRVQKDNYEYHRKSDRHMLWTGKSNLGVQETKIECPCGVFVKKKGFKRHQESERHKRLMTWRNN